MTLRTPRTPHRRTPHDRVSSYPSLLHFCLLPSAFFLGGVSVSGSTNRVQSVVPRAGTSLHANRRDVPSARDVGAEGTDEPLVAWALRGARICEKHLRDRGVRRQRSEVGAHASRRRRMGRGRPRRHRPFCLQAVRRLSGRHLHGRRYDAPRTSTCPPCFCGPSGTTTRRFGSRSRRRRDRNGKWRRSCIPTPDPWTFTAPNLQYFMDSPTELAELIVSTFTVPAGDPNGANLPDRGAHRRVASRRRRIGEVGVAARARGANGVRRAAAL